ncbi:MAG: hypothetical protein EOO51_07035 [Flavobacterium sp.]|nr:MAG: hypothetical protein EOO51_07035 [Flavobacterium sp.]
MTTSTIVLLFLSIVIAGGVSFYQYLYKQPRSATTKLLAVLRFLSILGLLLLLINPVVSTNRYETEKAPLAIVIDNSQSIKELKAGKQATEVFNRITSNSSIKEKFDVQPYAFDSEFRTGGASGFDGTQTNVEEVAKNLRSINKNKAFATVLITDGNQTTGNEYTYAFDVANKVYPVAVGDTTTFLDLKISQINANRYAFKNNKFPVEIFLQYAGNKTVNASFSIRQGNSVLSSQPVNFSPQKRSAVVNLLLPANATGLQLLKAVVTSSEKEKNTYNNSQNFAVEVIDQKTEVAIVSAINHPDLGALRRSIENNAQRKVTIIPPGALKQAGDYNVTILYQPNASFKNVFESVNATKSNYLVITGMATDFNFLNQQQGDLSFKMSGQSEDYLADFNPQFNLFALDNIGFENFPPLQQPFGNVKIGESANVLLSARIRNIPANAPLMAFWENGGRRSAFLLGENIWKWRMQSHIDEGNFEKFDIFIDKTIQFLASDSKRKSLVVNHENFYNSGDPIEITAQFFNKNYEFDEKARLSITVTDRETKRQKKFDMLRGSNSYKVNLDGMTAGKYDFSVRELNSNSVYNSYFEVLDFNIEKQFVNPDLPKLNQLAAATGGKTYLPQQTDELIKKLLDDENYKAVRKTITRKTPLIDWIWLLVIVSVTLAAEWLIRKYNGML